MTLAPNNNPYINPCIPLLSYIQEEGAGFSKLSWFNI